MFKILSNAKTKITGTVSSLLSVLGIGGGGASAVCQTTCSASSSVLPLIGVSLSATPLAFLEDYQLLIWWIALAFLGLLVWFYIKGISKSIIDRALLVVNTGLLTMGFPYLKELSVVKLFPWIGVVVLVAGMFSLITSTKFAIKFEG